MEFTAVFKLNSEFNFFSFYVGVIFVFSACIWNILMNETEYFFYRKKLFFLTVFYIVTA